MTNRGPEFSSDEIERLRDHFRETARSLRNTTVPMLQRAGRDIEARRAMALSYQIGKINRDLGG